METIFTWNLNVFQYATYDVLVGESQAQVTNGPRNVMGQKK